MKPFGLILAVCACMLTAAAQPPPVAVLTGPDANRKLIWVQSGNRLAAFDTVDFRRRQTVVLPSEATRNPERISISSQGAVMVAYTPGEDASLRRIWQSDPLYGSMQASAINERRSAPCVDDLIAATGPEVYLTNDPERLFWFENRPQCFTRDSSGASGNDSVETVFSAWTTNRRGGDVRQVAEIDFPKCDCTTGACSESCPQALVWAPEAGISDFFFVTRWVPGQLEPRFLQTDLYRLQNGRWASQKLAAPVEAIADAADHGNVFIEIVSDAGCCGWENESDDHTVLYRNGQSTVIYDERQRFHNDNYDVSFFTSGVKLSPTGRRLAYTLASTAPTGVEIRLASDGKNNPEELKRVKQAIADLPRFEVLNIADPKKIVISLPGEFAGWLDEKRLLIVQAGELVVIEADSGARTPIQIKAENAQRVFVR
jgi:hypothetical protein